MSDKPKAIQFDATLNRCARRADRSAGLSLVTSIEAPGEFMAWCDDHHQGEVEVLIAEKGEASAEVVDFGGAKDGHGQTASQRLRFAIVGRYNRIGGESLGISSEEFYQREMQSIINTIVNDYA